MRIAVTGADGFIGRHLTAKLAEAGHKALDLGPAEHLDIQDSRNVRARLSALKPDVIFHLAGVSGPMLHLEEPELVMAVNGVGTVNVLESARRLGRVPVILASSVAGYTSGTARAPRPASVYGVTKRSTELLAAVYREEFALPCTSVRIGSVYGPGRYTWHVLNEMVQCALRGADVPFAHAGLEPLVHVRDAAALLTALVAVPNWRPTYDLVTTPTSHPELAHVVCTLAGTGSRPFAENRPVERWPVTFNANPLYEDTGRKHDIDVRAGIAELITSA